MSEARAQSPGLHRADRGFRYLAATVTLPSTLEQLRTTSAGDCLRDLVDHLENQVTNPTIVNALLWVIPRFPGPAGQSMPGPRASRQPGSGAPWFGSAGKTSLLRAVCTLRASLQSLREPC